MERLWVFNEVLATEITNTGVLNVLLCEIINLALSWSCYLAFLLLVTESFLMYFCIYCSHSPFRSVVGVGALIGRVKDYKPGTEEAMRDQ